MPFCLETFSRNLAEKRAWLSPMKLVLDSHNVEVNDAIKEHVQNCVVKLEHMNQRAVEARVHLERDHVGLPTNKFKCAINLYFKGAYLFAEDYENDLYASIDAVTKKIQAQLRKRHNKIITRHHSVASKAKEELQTASV